VSDLPPNPYSPESQGLRPARHRPASVQLRADTDAGADLNALMDPAARSLADALRITYRILQAGMLALVVVFLFSGVKSVQSNEKGVRLLLGKIENDDLPPGFQMTLPAPFGELVTIPAGVETAKLTDEFWPRLPEADRRKPPAELRNLQRGKLDPDADGSIITADGSLAHARFSVTYRRDRVGAYLASVRDAEQAERMVRAAVMRGVVHAASGVSIDEFLKNKADAGREGTYRDIATTVKAVAQKTLDDMKSGLLLEGLEIEDRTPPFDVINAFEKVQTEVANADLLKSAAKEEKAKILAGAAGQNAQVILAMIDRYDTALSSGDDPAAEAELARIDDLLEGKTIRGAGPKGEDVQGVGGKAAALLNAAREYRSSVVSRSQADAALFEVKLASFRNNPSVMVQGEWTEAYRQFLSQQNVEVLSLPPNTSNIDLLLNMDPSLRRQAAIKRQQEDASKKAAEQAKEMEDRKFNTEKPAQQLNAQ
jgi:regulator of protease activity HflC (stomatin/prohibitin superfamily)